MSLQLSSLTHQQRVVLPTLLMCCFLSTAFAADPAVKSTNYVAQASTQSTGQVVKFSQQPTEVGSQVLQTVNNNLEIHSTITQSGQVANQSTTKVNRRQQRLIEVTEVAKDQVRRAKVSFPHSRMISPENPDPAAEVKQVVEGKSYLVTREGKQLLVTDLAGVIPAIEEYKIVVDSVRTLGLPNPLAKLLTSRTIRIGDRLLLPQEVASSLLGFSEDLGQVQMFQLVLNELRTIDNRQCAIFTTNIKIVDSSNSLTKIDAQGQVAVEIATCRTIAANLSGPLKMKAYDTNYQYSAEGGLQVAIQSRYQNARK